MPCLPHSCELRTHKQSPSCAPALGSQWMVCALPCRPATTAVGGTERIMCRDRQGGLAAHNSAAAAPRAPQPRPAQAQLCVVRRTLCAECMHGSHVACAHSTCRPAPCMHLRTCEHQGDGRHERHRNIAHQRNAGQLVQGAHCIEKGKKEERCRPGARIKGAQRRVK